MDKYKKMLCLTQLVTPPDCSLLSCMPRMMAKSQIVLLSFRATAYILKLPVVLRHVNTEKMSSSTRYRIYNYNIMLILKLHKFKLYINEITPGNQ